MKRLIGYAVIIAVLLLVIPAAVAATDVTVFLHNDQVELTGTQYFIDVTGYGRFHSGDTLSVPTPAALTVVTWTGPSLRGPPKVINLAAGQNQLAIEYATAEVDLTGWGGEPLTDKDIYYLVIQGMGNKGTGDTIHVPAATTLLYQACTYNVCGPFDWVSFPNGGVVTLGYEYSKVTVSLHNDGTPLAATGEYYLDVMDIDTFGTGGVFYVPNGALVSYHAVTEVVAGSPISGPVLSAVFGTGAQDLVYEYATVTARLHNGGTDLTDTAMYYLEIEGIGLVGTGGTFHVPENAVISYRACTNGLCGPWLTRSFVAGDQTFDVEFMKITVKLFNGATQLLDKTKYYLEIQEIGKLGYDEFFYVPAQSDITYRAWTGTTISGPWQVVGGLWSGGNHELRYEYATVKFAFDLSGGSCTLQTRVTGITTPVANGGKVHVPWDADVSFRADVCGWMSGVKTMKFDSGEGTVTWSMTATYT